MNLADIPLDGPQLSSESDALDLLGSFYGQEVDVVVIPVSRMAPEFWQLKTKLAGLFIQKLMNYQMRPAFVGDLSAEIAASEALRDYVRECRRGKHVFFATTRAELDGML